MKLKIILLLLSVIFSATSLILLQMNKTISTAIPEATAQMQQTEHIPTHIRIPSVGINLAVKEGGTIGTTWILSADAAYFLQETHSLPLVIYAHKRATLFANLAKTSIGDQVDLTMTNKQQATYTIKSKREVLPKDVEVLTRGTSNELVLITCSGWFDEKRLIITAEKN